MPERPWLRGLPLVSRNRLTWSGMVHSLYANLFHARHADEGRMFGAHI